MSPLEQINGRCPTVAIEHEKNASSASADPAPANALLTSASAQVPGLKALREALAKNGGGGRVIAGDLDAARASLAQVPAGVAGLAAIEAARAGLVLAEQAASAGPLAELEARVGADPGDHQARFDYAQALFAGGQAGEAIDQLLELFRRDREWNDGAARAKLLSLFEAVGLEDPWVAAQRRRLSLILFG